MNLTTVDRLVEERLGQAGHRYTPARRRVVAALDAAPGPQSAAELAETIGAAVPVSSLYRTLTVLESAGVAAPHHGSITRYELAEWLAGHHHHLVCSACGGVEDFTLDEADEQRIHEVVGDILTAADFVASGHTLDIEGVCAACR